MAEPMSAERLAEIRARAEAATPGPWSWDGNTDMRHIRLATPHGMSMTVMDFVRYGMQGAQPRFGIAGMMHNGSGLVEYEVAKWSKDIYRRDVSGIDHPDARFIAGARADVDDLLAEVDRLRAEAYRLRLASSPEFARTLGRTERERDEARADRDALAEQVSRVRALFADGGPDTPCRTAWRGQPGWTGGPAIECVEVPMDDLRAALGGVQ